jgi:hypothetical protein
VAERVLAYRAQLLAGVAKQLQNFTDVERVAGVLSFDISGQRRS